MKFATIILAFTLALTGSLASARSHHHRHHRMHGSAATSDPNGTAGGPTSVSGTGSSKFGGQVPGAPGATRQ